MRACLQLCLDPEVVEKCVLLAGDSERMPAALNQYVPAANVLACEAAKAMMVDTSDPPTGYLEGYMSSAMTSMYDSSGSLSSMASDSLASWRKAIW